MPHCRGPRNKVKLRQVSGGQEASLPSAKAAYEQRNNTAYSRLGHLCNIESLFVAACREAQCPARFDVSTSRKPGHVDFRNELGGRLVLSHRILATEDMQELLDALCSPFDDAIT